MTKAAALYNFFSQFGLNAWPNVSVPTGDDAPDFPYLTYELSTSADLDKIMVSASLWYRETTWTRANAKAEQISAAIGQAYTLDCDDGGMIIRRATPFSQSMDDPNDNLIKRKLLNFEITFCTPY